MTRIDELPSRWRQDRLVCSDAVGLGRSWLEVDGDALVTVAAHRSGTSVAAYGPDGAAARLVTALVSSGRLSGPLHWLTMPRDGDLASDVAAALDVEPLPGWDWLSTDTAPPPQPREGDVVRLDPAVDADAIRECLRAANPGTEADPAGPHEAGWWGVASNDGGLVGVIGASRRGAAEPGRATWHLHGLGVHPVARRQGLGRALTAAAVRDGLRTGSPWVSLGVWADNEAALAMYAALGFRTDHRRRSYRPVGLSTTHPSH